MAVAVDWVAFMTTKKQTKWTSSDIPSQAGRRIIITGANSGIGWEAALALARAGAEVVLAARTTAKGQDAVDRIGLRGQQHERDLSFCSCCFLEGRHWMA
jgi:NADPH:quinone reductase-like Zn-dependent oxidoreductase